MDRSKFPQGVEVQQTDLEYTETGKAQQILRRFLDDTQTGVADGCEVTPSGTAGRVAIAEGRTYASNGEWIPVAATSALAMADATLDVINIICAVYSEIDTEPGAHETDGTVKYRRAQASSTITAYTQAQYDALSLSAKGNIAILAKATAQGSLVPLSTSDIESPRAYSQTYTMGPVVNCTGITLQSVSTNTGLSSDAGNGDASIIMDTTISPRIQYAAPSDTPLLGASQLITTSGVYVLPSNTPSLTLTVFIDIDFLPVEALTQDDFPIGAIYEEVVQRQTANDDSHRHYTGSQASSATNAHGTWLEDIVQGLGRLGWGARLGHRLTATNQGLVPRLVADQDANSTHMLLAKSGGVGSGGAAEVITRLYKDFTNAFYTTQNAKYDAVGTQWTLDNATKYAQRLTVDEEIGGTWSLGRFPGPLTSSDWEELVGSDPDLVGSGGTGYILRLGHDWMGATPAWGYASYDARLRIDYSKETVGPGDVRRTLLLESQPQGITDGTIMRVYRKEDTVAASPLEITWNCSWSNNSNWRSDAAGTASILFMDSTQLVMRTQDTIPVPGSPWTDSGWTTESFRVTTEVPPLTPSTASKFGKLDMGAGVVRATNTAKAWGTISNGAGVIVHNAYNVSSASIQGASNEFLRVNFTNSIPLQYSAIATYNGASARAIINPTKTATYVQFSFVNIASGVTEDLAVATGGFNFVIFGPES